jgi:hypothetical protein
MLVQVFDFGCTHAELQAVRRRLAARDVVFPEVLDGEYLGTSAFDEFTKPLLSTILTAKVPVLCDDSYGARSSGFGVATRYRPQRWRYNATKAK